MKKNILLSIALLTTLCSCDFSALFPTQGSVENSKNQWYDIKVKI